MKKIVGGVLLASLIISCNEGNNQVELDYPETKKGDVSFDYFGESIADPYHWLEDDRSEETEAWVKAQNEVTFGYLDQIPYRNKLKNQLESKWNYEKIGAPFVEGDYTYYFKNDGLQNQSVMYQIDKDGNEEVFLDPNTFSEKGTTSLASISFSKDGSLLAYAISEGGSDWRKVIVMNTNDKSIVGDTLQDVKFSGLSWYNNEGFYYSSYEKPEGSELSSKTDEHKLYYHVLNTPQKDDKVIFGNDLKRRYVGGYVTENQNYLVITAANATYGNELYIKDLTADTPIKNIVNNMDNSHSVLNEKDGKLFIITDLDAPNQRLVSVEVKNPAVNNWQNVIAETENTVSFSKAGQYLFANYMKDALSVVKQYDYDGNEIREIELPGLGSASGFGDKSDATELYYSFTNYVTPSTIYKLDLNGGTSEEYQKPAIDFNPDDYESKQVFYTSKDGTKVPMMITYKKGTQLDGNNPTILYAYGGFNVSLTPSFSVANAVWMENGGVYAVANLRGGGEYGKEWHIAGTQMQKQNVFDDFIAAAEFLIDEKYTSSDYLAIRGGSNGGLLVAACMTQRPELFRVALPAVGVLDMLRYHTFTAGAGWAYDYGTSEDSKEMFDYIKAYSPVHNVKENVEYPATLITTADHDDRVVPAHSFKFAAELQDKYSGNRPMLIRIDVDAGHGAGKSMEQTINENADIQAFTLYNMGIKKI